MTKKSLILLTLQKFIGRIAIFILAPLYFLTAKMFFYRVRDLKETRRLCAAEFAKHKGGWIVCSNHLTMIDSFILSYAMFSLPQHIIHYKKMPWNLPEWTNYKDNFLLTILCYLSKCIPINRGGAREKMKESLGKCMYLLKSGETIMIFPEGKRSRTGRVDQEGFSYGVGRFIKHLEDCKVMCIYLRGDKQDNYSVIPAWGEKFSVHMEVFQPQPAEGSELRVQREYARQIIERLAQMEEAYFALRRKRCGGFEGTGELGKKQGFALSKKNPHRC
ncbi:MAG TPA: lysophospholipid acyltransferase family protein [Smithella sp.]|nr:lysophospholipid acyltransferase family protein [Smithella sp.]HOG90800.1 lysophospholipid acyltransferase family protein [Smithella sp.]HOU50327.1 lysophospholipid acyltransferase family protein [Smithella sp.]